MKKLDELSIFFPAYNEESNINSTVENALRLAPSLAERFEIIIVDDGSRDGTGKAADLLSEHHDTVKAVHHPVNRGYGAALRSGFSAARYGYIFFTDGDGQFNMEELHRLVDIIDKCDIAIGYRVKRNDPPHRIINARAFNLLIRILFGLKIRDIDCAFKLLKRGALDSIPALESDGAFISTELLVKSGKYGLHIEEVGVTHLPRKRGKSTGNKPGVVIKAFIELFKLWKKLK